MLTTFTLTINEQQMDLIEQALKLLQSNQQSKQDMSDEDLEEIDIMVGMIPMTRVEENEEPGTIHGWCF